MINISDTAGIEIKKVLAANEHKGKALFINFLGFGWSGPVLGLALDEPDKNCSFFESNGIGAYINTDLVEQLKPLGGVVVDFVDNGADQRGFMVTTKTKPEGLDCSGGCEKSSDCGDHANDNAGEQK